MSSNRSAANELQAAAMYSIEREFDLAVPHFDRAFRIEPGCRQYVQQAPAFKPFLAQPELAGVLHD